MRFRYVLLWIAAAVPLANVQAYAAVYYVRQTVGNDANDGLTARTAWRTIEKLWHLKAGDTAYVGPGLYRGAVHPQNDGTAGQRITFIADNDGKYTGDPPGRVLIAGSEPIDESAFSPTATPGVYSLRSPGYAVLGVVEMDGTQFRYQEARRVREHIVDKLTELQVVQKHPSYFYYDEGARTLYIHTSDGKAPRTHEIELIRRGAGFYLGNRHYITVIGFSIRHVGDAGINFFKGAGDGAAFFNTSYGSRQGIRVYAAPNILVHGNTLFRNENSGVYFAAESVNGAAIRNVTYENVKGLRWSTKSGSAVVIENVAFENRQAGIALENMTAVVRSNRLGRNRETQLLALGAEYTSDENCFELGRPEELLADFSPHPRNHRFKTLEEYQKTRGQDLASRELDCGPWPRKLDVHKIHAESLTYRDKALKILAASARETPAPTATPTPQPP